MSNDDGDRGIARRKVLAAAAGAGGLGVAGGLGSAALLRDEESFEENLFESGSLDLVVDSEDATAEGNIVTLPIDLGPDQTSESALLDLSFPDVDGNNPGNIWFWLTCPEPSGTRLAEALRIEIWRSDENENKNELLSEGSLLEVANGLRDGGYLLDFGGTDTTCLPTGTSEYLLVEWELDGSYSCDETLDFSFEFRARQCRNDDGTESPFPSLAPCAARTPCPCCRLVGKLELEDEDDADGSLDSDDDGLDDSFIEPGTYHFSEGTGDYKLVVDEVETKGSGTDMETTAVSIDVVGVGSTQDPELCEVVVKASTSERTYDECDLGSNEDGYTELLYSVPKQSGGYFGISSITVGICTDEDDDGSCPTDLVSPTGNASQGGGA